MFLQDRPVYVQDRSIQHDATNSKEVRANKQEDEKIIFYLFCDPHLPYLLSRNGWAGGQ